MVMFYNTIFYILEFGIVISLKYTNEPIGL